MRARSIDRTWKQIPGEGRSGQSSGCRSLVRRMGSCDTPFATPMHRAVAPALEIRGTRVRQDRQSPTSRSNRLLAMRTNSLPICWYRWSMLCCPRGRRPTWTRRPRTHALPSTMAIKESLTSRPGEVRARRRMRSLHLRLSRPAEQAMRGALVLGPRQRFRRF